MEIFFDILMLPSFLILILVMNFCTFSKMCLIEDNLNALHLDLVKGMGRQSIEIDILQKKTDELSDELIRSIATLKELFTSNKPIKPNNWENLKAAFSGPARVENHE